MKFYSKSLSKGMTTILISLSKLLQFNGQVSYCIGLYHHHHMMISSNILELWCSKSYRKCQ